MAITGTPRTSTDLVRKSFDIIGLGSSDRTLSGDKAYDGIFMLNAILDDLSNRGLLIPYYTVTEFPVVSGQRVYTISSDSTLSPDVNANMIIEPQYVVLIDVLDYQYPVTMRGDAMYYTNQRDLSKASQRPSDCFFQNSKNLTTFTFYTFPEEDYTCQIKGKSILNNVEISTELVGLPTRMELFLVYELAKELANSYPGSIWDTKRESRYQDLKNGVYSTNDNDLRVNTGSALLQKRFFAWSDFNSV